MRYVWMDHLEFIILPKGLIQKQLSYISKGEAGVEIKIYLLLFKIAIRGARDIMVLLKTILLHLMSFKEFTRITQIIISKMQYEFF